MDCRVHIWFILNCSFPKRPMTVTELYCRKRLTVISGIATYIMKEFTIMRAMMVIFMKAVSRNWVELLCKLLRNSRFSN